MKIRNKMNDIEITKLVICLIVVFVTAVLLLVAPQIANNKYNEGICRNCGGHLELFDIVGTRTSPIYYYKCDSCGYMMQSVFLMQAGK